MQLNSITIMDLVAGAAAGTIVALIHLKWRDSCRKSTYYNITFIRILYTT